MPSNHISNLVFKKVQQYFLILIDFNVSNKEEVVVIIAWSLQMGGTFLRQNSNTIYTDYKKHIILHTHSSLKNYHQK